MSRHRTTSKLAKSSFILAAVAVCAAVACGTEMSEPPSSAEHALDCTNYPETGFEAAPNYLGRHVFALTFDDGPDTAGETGRLLELLKNQYPTIKASFFINIENLEVNKGAHV